MNRIRYLLMAAALTMTSVATAQKDIAVRQYWLDAGIAGAGELTSDHASIDISSLSPGLHTLTLRVQDSEGVWGPQVSCYFVKPYATGSEGSSAIAQHQYWIDGHMQSGVASASKPEPVDISSLSPGLHTITLRVQDSEGLWGPQVSCYFIKPYAVGGSGSGSIVRHQYWIDGNVQATVASDSKPGPIDISSLNAGLHTLTVLVQDQAGYWSQQVTKCFIKPYAIAGEGDKTVVEHQYWIDGRVQARVTGADAVSLIDIEGLQPGLHSLSVRVKDNTGTWSSPVNKLFVTPYAEISVGDKAVVEHQYWIDGKMEARVTGADPVSLIDIEGLQPGLHSLSVRVKDNTGTWSSQVARFFVVADADTSAGDKTIVEHQYWIDGKTEAIVSSPAQFTAIDSLTLEPGLHSLSVRVKAGAGTWSAPATRYFILREDDVIEPTTIARYKYWFDEETSGAKAGELTSASDTMNIDISDVEAGEHTLWWCVGDSKGAWSEARSTTFNSKSLYNFTVPESGVGTFAADVNLTLPDGLKAHFCTELKETEEGLGIKVVDIDSITGIINQNTGVLLSGTPGETYQLRYTTDAGTPVEGNNLVPVVEPADIEAVVGQQTNYIMQDGSFVKIDAAGASMPGHSAYLSLPTTATAEADFIVLVWKDSVETGTGNAIKADYDPERDGRVYNVYGQRLSAPRKGVNIIGGRKVIIK